MAELRELEGRPYGGYYQTEALPEDAELTHTGPGTPCGEYLRRFWHPVGIASTLADLPRRVSILGEDLVLFRDGGGRIGLLHLRCAHRRASLEYGIVSARGIRCCYHGWLFDVDGTILETPGDPADSAAAAALRRGLCQGAYPVHEYKGLVFAYLGPPDEKPTFPVYDTFDIPGMEMVPYEMTWPCNWLQVLDAIVDPVHTVFLHTQISRAQFSPGLGELGEVEYFKTPVHLFATNTRRVGANIWVRINELVAPNFTQAGAAFATDGLSPRYFGRSAFTRWVVPADDHNTHIIAWANFGERGDPPEYNTPDGIDRIEQGEVLVRPYEERQRRPGDYEATTGMERISVHRREHLTGIDKGVVTMRSRLRRGIRELKKGKAPLQPGAYAGTPVPTYGGDTVLAIAQPNGDDRALLRRVARRVVDAHREADGLVGEARTDFVEARLRAIEADGPAQ